jgi:predicted dehydrogenase
MIGCGGISRSHTDAYLRLTHEGRPVKLLATADISAARAQEGAVRAGISTWFTDYRAVLEMPEITAVNICTSNSSHAEIAIAAAKAGKHVLLEKPLALNLEEADAIIAACKQEGVKLMVGQTARFDAIKQEMRAAIVEGSIGTPVHLNEFSYHGFFWRDGWNGWQIDLAKSGGHFLHNGVHDIDFACWIMQAAPVRVYARGLKLASPALDTFDYYELHLTFPNGATALCEGSYSIIPHEMLLRGVRLYGTEGEASHNVLADGATWTRAGAEAYFLAPLEGMYDQMAHWIDCLEHDKTPLVKPEQSRMVLAVALAAERSANTGEIVTFEETPYA